MTKPSFQHFLEWRRDQLSKVGIDPNALWLPETYERELYNRVMAAKPGAKNKPTKGKRKN